MAELTNGVPQPLINNWDYTQDIELSEKEKITSLYIYEDVNCDVSFNLNNGEKTVKGYKYSSNTDIRNLVMGYTKINYAYKTKDEKNEEISQSILFEPVKVQYDKQVYKPGLVKVQLSVTGGEPKKYAEILKQLFVTSECKVSLIACLDKTYDANLTEISKIYKIIAKWYYVQNVSLSRKQDNTTIATLTCYSPDYKLTLDKYSQVFKSKKFSSDIFTNILTTEKGFESKETPTNADKPSCFTSVENLMYLRYDAKTLTVGALGNESMEDQTEGKAEEVKKVTSDELIQPYLVQYNESFYDFLCRVANRCGEFLYYEDGVLRLGLPKSTRKILNKSKLSSNDLKYNVIDVNSLKPVSVSYPEISIVEDDSNAPELFFYNSARYTKSDLLDTFNGNHRLSSKDYHRDKALKNEKDDVNTALDAKKKYYVPENSADEQLYHFSDRDIPDINCFDYCYTPVAAMSAYASAESGAKGLVGLALGVILNVLGTKKYVDPVINFFLTTRKYQIADFEKILMCKDVNDGNKEIVKQRSSILNSVYDNLCNRFYEQMKRCEEKVTDNKVTLDFNSSIPEIGLCDAITLHDGVNDAYIVTAMRGEFTKDSHSHTVEAVPVIADSSSKYIDLQRSRGEKDQAPALVIPPYAVAHTLPGSPQEAIVRDNRDPLEMGRVRITYLWQSVGTKTIDKDKCDDSDLDEGYSPWVRMTTPFAGGRGGMVMTPEVGNHVMVNYFNNNMENPYIEGALFTREQAAPGYTWEYQTATPYALAFQPTVAPRTIQSASGHGIIFFDGKDGNFLKDHIVPTIGQPLNLIFKTLGIDSHFFDTNSGGMTLCDASGFYSIDMNAGKRAINISSPLGTVSMNAFTGITISAPNGDVKIQGKNITLSAGNNIKIESGTNISKKETSTVDTVAGVVGSTVQTLAGIGIDVGNKMVNKAVGFNITKFLDLSFLRASWEVFLRPVEGTLSIATPRNITMTAGLGRTIVPSYLMSDVKTGLSLIGNKKAQLQKDDPNKMVRIKGMLEVGQMAVDEVYNSYSEIFKEVKAHINTLYTMLSADKSKHVTALKKLSEEKDFLNEFKDILLDGENLKTKADIAESITNKKEYDKVRLTKFHGVMHYRVNDLIEEYNAAIEAYKKIDKIEKDQTQYLIDNVNASLSYVTKNNGFPEICLKKSDVDPVEIFNAHDSSNPWEIFDGNDDNPNYQLIINQANHDLTLKYIFFAILKHNKDFISMKDGVGEWIHSSVKNHWNAIILSLTKVEKEEDSTAVKMLKAIGNGALDAVLGAAHYNALKGLVNWNGCAGPRAMSDVTTGGNILISNKAGKTMRINETSTGFDSELNPSVDTIKDFLRRWPGTDIIEGTEIKDVPHQELVSQIFAQLED